AAGAAPARHAREEEHAVVRILEHALVEVEGLAVQGGEAEVLDDGALAGAVGTGRVFGPIARFADAVPTRSAGGEQEEGRQGPWKAQVHLVTPSVDTRARSGRGGRRPRRPR